MPAPYDLSGIATLRTVFDQMVLDQTYHPPLYLLDDTTGKRLIDDYTGAFLLSDPFVIASFAGGYQTWLSRELGWFKAILSPGGSLVATTTANVRLSLETLRITFDVLAASAGTLAISIAIAAQSPPFTLAAGKTPASGAVSAGTQVIADTNYNLSSLTTLQAVATQMVQDAQNSVTNFGGGAQPNTFQAILQPSGPVQTTTMLVVRRYLAGARSAFDLLDQ